MGANESKALNDLANTLASNSYKYTSSSLGNLFNEINNTVNPYRKSGITDGEKEELRKKIEDDIVTKIETIVSELKKISGKIDGIEIESRNIYSKKTINIFNNNTDHIYISIEIGGEIKPPTTETYSYAAIMVFESTLLPKRTTGVTNVVGVFLSHQQSTLREEGRNYSFENVKSALVPYISRGSVESKC